MSIRALLRSNADYIPIELPSYLRPQVVDQDGFEVDYDEAQAAEADRISVGLGAQDDDQQGADVEEAEEVAEEQLEVETDVQLEEVDAEDEEQNEEDVREPLLSLTDSLVLPYSLTQTRHRHLTSLFPHIFSHPPIPSNSKPRIRPPPRSTFQFPTPPAPIQPLPNPEYHGPSIFADPPKQGESSKSIDTPSPSNTTPASKVSRPPRPKKLGNEEWPAHEIECISRCTLSVGPISFPGTEIWIGRFVEPRATQPKPPRAKPGERKEKRKSMAGMTDSAKRSRAKPTGVERPNEAPSRLPPKTTLSSPSNTPPPIRPNTPTAYMPRPPTYRPLPGPPPPPRPIPPPARPTTASPQLIQLVNQAATRHAWLSALIYKAAGSTANQVELERLGKAVARLSRGEPIEDLAPPEQSAANAGPSSATTAQPRPPTQTAPTGQVVRPSSQNLNPITQQSMPDTVPSASVEQPNKPSPQPEGPQTSSTGTIIAPPVTAGTESSTTTTTTQAGFSTKPDSDSDSDDEVDMTGRPQVGGGPLPPPPAPNDKPDPLPIPPSDANISDSAAVSSTTSTGTNALPASASGGASMPGPALYLPPSAAPKSNAGLAAKDSITSASGPPFASGAATALSAASSGPSAAVSIPVASVNAPVSASGFPVPPQSTSVPSGSASIPPPSGSLPISNSAPMTQPGPISRPDPITQPGYHPIPPFAQPYQQQQHAPPITPPPPKPTYPLPPPFLLIAFKEQPTEKFLLPLGMRSYISRMGGDYVTGPRPPTPIPETITRETGGNDKNALPIPSENRIKANSDGFPPPVPTSDNISNIPAVPISEPSTADSGSAPQQSLRGRTRQSLGRHAKEPAIDRPTPSPKEPTPPADIEIKIETESPKVPLPESGLPPLPGQKIEDGTVLVSTVIPSGITRWDKIEWEGIKKDLPFDNPLFWDIHNQANGEVKKEPQKALPPPAVPQAGPSRELRHPRTAPESKSTAAKLKHRQPDILNLAAKNFMPDEGDLQPITMRLKDIDDKAWARIRDVIEITEKSEIERMFNHDPALLDGVDLDNQGGVAGAAQSDQTQTPATLIPERPTFPETALASRQSGGRGLSIKAISYLRPTYISRKASAFTQLLKRVPPRSFLQTRVAEPMQEIIDATTDKWAPRPYPISTKPLYQPDENDYDDEDTMRAREIEFSPPPNKKTKKGEESAVTFEVPVSYDLLDEKVAEGVKNDLLNVRGAGRIGRKYTKRASTGADGDKPKRVGIKGKRGVQNGICEGCGMENVKVWRRGPTGRGTLCHPCGDLFLAGQLPPLKRPGAMKAFLNANGGEAEDAVFDENEDIQNAGDKGEQRGASDTDKQPPDVNTRDVNIEAPEPIQIEGSVSQPDTTVQGTSPPATEIPLSNPTNSSANPAISHETEVTGSTSHETADPTVTAQPAITTRIGDPKTATAPMSTPALTEHPISDPTGTSVSGGFKEQGELSRAAESGTSISEEVQVKEVETTAGDKQDEKMDVDT
ncbi:uncharacterized protein I303_101006 [Kwoniella dejecticola CBS 10117]|uniref:GATA-type domain-containing protein n=1 Tax=Kwoniella dejecticola CBS 10117 TaxID=1296121 RepID=A0A1A6AGK7_9TREE|nr:uncharacterized protein I303_01010 [Kwoniella dejecticola CBS 10117]OBR89186.1 hypothetical protein I303_01010 [Kwoniella dejecticola CBS 10117]